MKIAIFVSLAVAAACCTGTGAVELTHRWSFNAADDYTDSVGGVVAAKMGTALHIADREGGFAQPRHQPAGRRRRDHRDLGH